MAVTPAALRAAFTEFTDPATYPDAEIQFWITLAYKLHNAGRYGDFLDEAVMLFVAHNLSLQFAAKSSGASGENPGVVQGPITSASVDKVSYSRDAGSAMDPKNGHWNLSSYGLRWITLQRLAGAGPVQIGLPSGFDSTPYAWPGPIF